MKFMMKWLFARTCGGAGCGEAEVNLNVIPSAVELSETSALASFPIKITVTAIALLLGTSVIISTKKG